MEELRSGKESHVVQSEYFAYIEHGQSYSEKLNEPIPYTEINKVPNLLLANTKEIASKLDSYNRPNIPMQHSLA